MNRLETLADEIHDILRTRGDSTATQIRVALGDTWDLQAGQVTDVLMLMIADGRVRRVKQYFRAVVVEAQARRDDVAWHARDRRRHSEKL